MTAQHLPFWGPKISGFDNAATPASERSFHKLLYRHPREAIAISDGVNVRTFGELIAELENRQEALMKSWSSGDSPFLPLLIDRTLDSCLSLITCLCYQIPFALIAPQSPADRVEQILSKLRGMDSDLTGHDSVSAPYLPPYGTNSFIVTSSGSTGNPKAIEISFPTHFNRMMLEIQSDTTIRTGESRIVTALLGSPTSVSGVNTLSKVFLGQSVHILDPVRLPMAALVSAIETLGVTRLRLPSQLARLMADFSNPQGIKFADVEEVTIGGESIFFETLESLKKYFMEDVKIVHTIGATEALGLAKNRFRLNEIAQQGQVPLGTLSSGVELVQVPQLGPSVYELVASKFLAEGYLGEPQLTSENFYVDESGTRRWRSGDLVVKTSTGEIMHCGRIDDVVKINGTVASPVETTRAIIDWPEVEQAITLPHKSLGKTFLVSHVEPKMIEGFDIKKLREFLSKKLPPHLRPAQIVLHNKIPSKEGGKIDRAQLRNWNVASDSSPK